MVRILVVLACLSGPAFSQTSDDIDNLLASSLTSHGGEVGASYLLTDGRDPATVGEAIGVIYEEIRGAAGNSMISVGHFVRQDDALVLARRIEGVFGQEPRDARFLSDRIELTTTMPKPDDARCCPTGASRWSIDRATMKASETPLE